MDDVEIKKVASFEKSLKDFVKSKYASLVVSIEVAANLSASDEKAMHGAIQDFKKTGSY
jgi:F-type H+-transporting ATPase subunit alpha